MLFIADCKDEKVVVLNNVFGCINEESCAQSNTNENFISEVQNACNSERGEIVCAYDDNGNQVAVGLLLLGPFQEINHADNVESSEWIAAEEECMMNEVSTSLSPPVVKEENQDITDTFVCDDSSKKSSLVIKTYKRRNNSKKTLRQIKMEMKKKDSVKKLAAGRATKISAVKSKSAIKKLTRKIRRRRKLDKSYKCPSSVVKEKLPRNFFLEIIGHII